MFKLQKHISLLLAIVFTLGVNASVIHFDDLHSHSGSDTGMEYVEDHTTCVICATVFKFQTGQSPSDNPVTVFDNPLSSGELSKAKFILQQSLDSRAPPFFG